MTTLATHVSLTLFTAHVHLRRHLPCLPLTTSLCLACILQHVRLYLLGHWCCIAVACMSTVTAFKSPCCLHLTPDLRTSCILGVLHCFACAHPVQYCSFATRQRPAVTPRKCHYMQQHPDDVLPLLHERLRPTATCTCTHSHFTHPPHHMSVCVLRLRLCLRLRLRL